MALRRARADDTEAICEVFVAARAGMTYLPNLHTKVETRAWIGDVVVAQNEVWVAVENARTVGFAALGACTLEHLCVLPDAQRRGLGAGLFATAKERRPDGFRLWVFQRNEAARRFYELHGCRLVELTDGSDNEELEPDALYEWPPDQRSEAEAAGYDPGGWT